MFSQTLIDKSNSVIQKSDKATNPMVTLIDTMRVRNTEIDDVLSQIKAEQEALAEKEQELLQTKANNISVIEGLSTIFKKVQ